MLGSLRRLPERQSRFRWPTRAELNFAATAICRLRFRTGTPEPNCLDWSRPAHGRPLLRAAASRALELPSADLFQHGQTAAHCVLLLSSRRRRLDELAQTL